MSKLSQLVVKAHMHNRDDDLMKSVSQPMHRRDVGHLCRNDWTAATWVWPAPISHSVISAWRGPRSRNGLLRSSMTSNSST